MTCHRCDSGLISVFPKDNPHAGYYVFKCPCVLGEARHEAYPKWYDRYALDWISNKKYLNDELVKNKPKE